MKHKLWVESHRPTSVNDYVFASNQQKTQVEYWIKEGTIPHLLLSGEPGTGKCLGHDEVIEIQLDIDSLTPKQQQSILKYKV